MENLDRGVIAIKDKGQFFISWRVLGTDADDLAFNLYRKSSSQKAIKLNEKPITGASNFIDTKANADGLSICGIHNPKIGIALALKYPKKQKFLLCTPTKNLVLPNLHIVQLSERGQNDASHAFYLGVELARAQIAWQLKKRYVQDEALDWGVSSMTEKVDDRKSHREASLKEKRQQKDSK